MSLAIDMVGTNLRSATRIYNINFCEHLNKKKLKKKIYVFISKEYFKDLGKNNNPNIKYIIKSNSLSNIILRFIWMQVLLPFELKRLGVKKLFSPMNFGPLFIGCFKIKLILGLHSNLPWIFFNKMPGNFFKKIFTKFIMQKSVIKSDKLIVVSKFAKNEILKFLKIDKNKIFPVYLGIDKNFLTTKKKKFKLKNFDYNDYILSVLSCVRYHNILNLLKAFKILKKDKSIKTRFVLVMHILDKNFFSEIINFIEKNFKEGEIIIYHNLENSFLANLYKNAIFYVFSSYSEVFGLTSLEAMSQKCPVLISNKSAISEINKQAAYYFNPDDIKQIKDSMNKLLINSKLRNKLITRGNNHFKNFTWKKTIDQTLEIIDI